MSFPDWLRRQLEASGHLDTDGVTRQVRSRPCPGCAAPVLVGLDADRCALAATVDPWPVDVHGELTASLAGRATYDLAGHWALELRWRDALLIAWPRRWPVVVAHECHAAPLPRVADPPRHCPRESVTDVPTF
jgi:hypothetical protein